ncbi:ABC transporter ATP-binding protein [Rhodopirellula halodulae]|uniref:ABC transporter ATP-binding protein n=1 Tax=Rhodopirellula halodulae TaxID=2894198 RepID=UPI0036F1EFE8
MNESQQPTDPFEQDSFEPDRFESDHLEDDATQSVSSEAASQVDEHDDASTVATEQQPLVEVRNLTVSFEGQTILKDIDCEIQRGQTVAVIGESGCGKTVFMKSIVALVQPTVGRVLFDGVDLASLTPAELAVTRRRFGFVFQHAALFDSMNIFDNVAFPIRQNEEDTDEEEVNDRVRQHLAEVGLPEEVIYKRPAELSGGMQKRVGLARALVLRPELIVYDEPTTGLDPIMSDVINELILHTRRLYPVTSIVVTHDMHTARKVADRVMMFYPRRRLNSDQSQILFDAPPSQLEHAEDRRVRQFVRGEAGDRIREMNQGMA